MVSAMDSVFSSSSILRRPPRAFLTASSSCPPARPPISIQRSSRKSRVNRALGGWSPSHLCFYLVDTVQTDDYTLADKKGRNTQLFALWTIGAAETASGKKRDVALLLLSNNDRLIRSGKLAGHYIRSVKAKIGKVPEVDENGVPSGDDRFQVKVGKTLVTWDGHQAADSAPAKGSVEILWTVNDGGEGEGERHPDPHASVGLADGRIAQGRGEG